MFSDLFDLVFDEDADLPEADAADHVLIRWLSRRLGRPPSWWEVLTLRAALQERDRRRNRWAWWRRLRVPAAPRDEDLVADFLASWEGQTLLALTGSLAATVARLTLPNPWQGFDGQHPTAEPMSRREILRDRVARGCAVSTRVQVAAVLAYAEQKLSSLPLETPDWDLDDAEFLSSAHCAAINAMSCTDVMQVCARLRAAGSNDAKRRTVLRELDRIGAEAIRLWPGVNRPGSDAPQGLWPPPSGTDAPEEDQPPPMTDESPKPGSGKKG